MFRARDEDRGMLCVARSLERFEHWSPLSRGRPDGERAKNRTSFILFERTAIPDTWNDENINRVSNNRLRNLYKGIPIVIAMFDAKKSNMVLSYLSIYDHQYPFSSYFIRLQRIWIFNFVRAISFLSFSFFQNGRSTRIQDNWGRKETKRERFSVGNMVGRQDRRVGWAS